MIREHTVQAANERLQAQHFCKEYTDKATNYYKAAYERECKVIKLLEENEIHQHNIHELSAMLRTSTGEGEKLKSQLAESEIDKAKLKQKLDEARESGCKCPTGCSAAARLAQALDAEAKLRARSTKKDNEIEELRRNTESL